MTAAEVYSAKNKNKGNVREKGHMFKSDSKDGDAGNGIKSDKRKHAAGSPDDGKVIRTALTRGSF